MCTHFAFAFSVRGSQAKHASTWHTDQVSPRWRGNTE